MWWNSVVEEWNSVVEQWNSDGGTVWWNTGTVIVEQCGGTVWWNSDCGPVWWYSKTVCATVLWNSETVMVGAVRIHWFRLDARPIRVKQYAVLKISGFVWK